MFYQKEDDLQFHLGERQSIRGYLTLATGTDRKRTRNELERLPKFYIYHIGPLMSTHRKGGHATRDNWQPLKNYVASFHQARFVE